MRNLEMIRALSDASSPGGSTDHPDAQNSQLQQDALLVLQALCKLSMQDLPPASSGTASVPADQRLVRCKRLSLELLLSMLEGSGAVFRSDERFMKVIRSLLCISLIKNCVSHVPRIFGLSLSIFLYLTVQFKVGVWLPPSPFSHLNFSLRTIFAQKLAFLSTKFFSAFWKVGTPHLNISTACCRSVSSIVVQ